MTVFPHHVFSKITKYLISHYLCPRRYMLVRYETFAANPVAVTRELFHFLGWEFHEHSSDLQQESVEEERRQRNDMLVPYYSTFRDLKSFDPNHWRHELSADDVRIVESMAPCKEAMQVFNYTMVNTGT
jgi:hypothetical protein